MQPKRKRHWMGMLASVILFLVVLVLLSFATSSLSGGASREGLAATQQAIERAAVLCYASEGYYPPSLEYIQENYGVQIDTRQYAVRYEVFASNQMPVIRVASW